MATIIFELAPFRAYALFSLLLPFFKRIVKVVFCEGVQNPPAIMSKWRPLSFIFNREKREK
jgi:hypothetical protein